MPNTPNMVTSAHDLSALLDWYEAAGADCTLDEAPQDRFEETARQLKNRQQVRSQAGKGRASTSNLTGSTPINPVQSGQRSNAYSSAQDIGQDMPHSAHPGQHGEAAGMGSQASGSTFTSKSIENQFTPLSNTDGTAGPNVHSSGATGMSSATGGNFLAPANAGLVDEARQRAASAPSLDALRETMASFNGCSLKFSAKNLVFGDGNPNAAVMFIGEAPGRDEDLSGTPFVGRAGQLLDLMMAAIGRDRSNAYITNILPWRPPGNRKPSLDEQAMLRPFIHRHIELVNPDVLVFLGGTAAQQLLGSKDGIMRLRGRWNHYAIGGGEVPQRDIPVMATLHPAFLLRTPAQKRAAWQDFLEIATKLDNLPS